MLWLLKFFVFIYDLEGLCGKKKTTKTQINKALTKRNCISNRQK